MWVFMGYRAVAIDGPSSAGKSTIAKQAAQSLGYIYVDTGALYRAIGLYIDSKGIDTTDTTKIEPILKSGEIYVQLRYIDGLQRVFLNGKDISEAIRAPKVSMFASNVSSIGAVRDFLFDLQRDIANTNSVIMDGRDIGTVVLPNADVKIFLTASAEIRAKRRYDEFIAKNEQVDFDELLKEIKQRDYNDSHREIAPLKQADDAVLIDTSDETLEQAVEHVISVISSVIKE